VRGCKTILFLLIAFSSSAWAQDKTGSPPVRTTPLSLSGRALDQAGQPIHGATIYVVSTNGSPPKLLGEATTHANGRYEFKDLPLPETRSAKPADEYQSGCFQVFGKAPGHAFSWRGMQFLSVNPGAARKRGFFAGDTIELDLTFAAPQRIHGRFIDEMGIPIADVKVQLGKCDFIHTAGKEDHVNFREFWAAYQAAEVMPEQLRTTTDAEGRFEFNSVPPGIVGRLDLAHPQFANVSLYTATEIPHPKTYQEQPVVDLPIDLTLYSVRSIPVLVERADTREPLSGVRILGRQDLASGNYAMGVSDENGKLTLKLPPGRYKLEGDPPKETDYIRTSQDLVIEQKPAEQPATLRINSGCVLILKAIDAETSAGIPDVTFWYEMTELPGGRPGRGKTSVQSHTTLVNNPKSNVRGELRAVVVPGKRRYGIGLNPLPQGYEAADRQDVVPGRVLDLPPGQTVIAEFKLRFVGRRSNN
jgi:protocatechuate 3,4-dioxygenase beta subunit